MYLWSWTLLLLFYSSKYKEHQFDRNLIGYNILTVRKWSGRWSVVFWDICITAGGFSVFLFLLKQESFYALTYCRANYADLASFRTDADLIDIQQEAKVKQFTSNALVGLYLNVNTWHWSLGNQTVGTFSQWASSYGEPNNWHGREECAALNPSGWWDLDCRRLFPFMCFDGELFWKYFLSCGFVEKLL